jgi:hypothetical protein
MLIRLLDGCHELVEQEVARLPRELAPLGGAWWCIELAVA